MRTAPTALGDDPRREVTYRNMSAIDGDPSAVRAHVARIAASELFAGAGRLCRFLRFTVESTLNGRAADIKEYTLGREVFDRGDDYDPRLDPIVRVEARRLRSRLAEYYAGPGRDESLRLEYRKGSYVPIVSVARNQPVAPVQATRRRSLRLGMLGVVVTAGLIGLSALHLGQAPMTAPIPATWIQRNDGTMDAVDVALAENVDEELANHSGSRALAWPIIARRSEYRGMDLRDVASQLQAPQLLIIMVRDQGEMRRISVFAIEEPQGRKRLALTYYADSSLATAAVQTTYASRIVRDLNQH